MGSNYIITSKGDFVSEEEIYHWGIKGMKWGIRRYQNEDGSLTAEGKKRYLNSDGTLNKKGKKKFGDSVKLDVVKKKTAKEMTDEELDRAIIRARKEDEYNRLRPEQTTDSKSSSKNNIMNKLINDMVVPAVINSGRNAMQKAIDKLADKYLKDKVDPNSIEALRKTYDRLKLEKDIADLKKSKEPSWDDKLKEQQYKANEKKEAEARAQAERERQTKEANAEAEARRRRQQVRNTMDRVSTSKSKSDKYNSRVRYMQDEFDTNWDPYSTVNQATSNRNKDRSFQEKVKSQQINYEFSANGKSFVDSHGNELFYVSNETSNRGKSFVNSHGDDLFRWDDDD